MALFDKLKLEKLGLDALAAASKAASQLGEKFEQNVAPKLKELQEKAAPHIENLKDRAAPHLETLKEKATEIASDVKEAVVGPALDTYSIEALVGLYQADAININSDLQQLRLDGLTYEVEVSDGPYLSAYIVEGGVRKQISKLDTVEMSKEHRDLILDLANRVQHANAISVAVHQKDPDTKWPDLHKLMPIAQFSTSHMFTPSEPKL